MDPQVIETIDKALQEEECEVATFSTISLSWDKGLIVGNHPGRPQHRHLERRLRRETKEGREPSRLVHEQVFHHFAQGLPRQSSNHSPRVERQRV
jgi:hypothetical protein